MSAHKAIVGTSIVGKFTFAHKTFSSKHIRLNISTSPSSQLANSKHEGLVKMPWSGKIAIKIVCFNFLQIVFKLSSTENEKVSRRSLGENVLLTLVLEFKTIIKETLLRFRLLDSSLTHLLFKFLCLEGKAKSENLK